MRPLHLSSAPAPVPADIDPEVARFVRGVATYLAGHDLERLPLAEVRALCELSCSFAAKSKVYLAFLEPQGCFI